jgi:BlaI family transcriptional regulator, penicillinase repressor
MEKGEPMNKTPVSLSPAEWEVMNKVWELKRTNVREVFEELRPEHGWAYNTVRTMMERLCEKEFLTAKRVGNMNFYEAMVSRSSVRVNALKRFVEQVFDGAAGSMVLHLIKSERLSEGELDEIRHLIQKEKKES